MLKQKGGIFINVKTMICKINGAEKNWNLEDKFPTSQ